MSCLLFGAKVDSLKKLIQRTHPPSHKMVEMLAAIQKHGKQKKVVIFFNNFNSLLIYLCVHKTRLCDSV
jgi:hypothetical protein